MRLIKLAFLSFIFLFGLITAISLLIPSHIRISKAINIGSSPNAIFSLLKDTLNWTQWHPAFMQQNGTLPQKNSNIRTETVNDSVVLMKFSQGAKTMYNGWQLYTFSSTDSLTLQWYMDFNLPWYPWQKFGSLFYEDTYGRMMEKGLVNLKKIVEKQE